MKRQDYLCGWGLWILIVSAVSTKAIPFNRKDLVLDVKPSTSNLDRKDHTPWWSVSPSITSTPVGQVPGSVPPTGSSTNDDYSAPEMYPTENPVQKPPTQQSLTLLPNVETISPSISETIPVTSSAPIEVTTLVPSLISTSSQTTIATAILISAAPTSPPSITFFPTLSPEMVPISTPPTSVIERTANPISPISTLQPDTLQPITLRPASPVSLSPISNDGIATLLPTNGYSIQQCISSLGSSLNDYYGAAESIGDGWCDDKSSATQSALFNLNSPICGYDGGDCCISSCNATNSDYSCRIAGFHCIDPRYRDQSSESNFTIEFIASNFSKFLSQNEANAIFLVGLQYEIISQSNKNNNNNGNGNILQRMSIISTVSSRFTTLMNHSVVIVDAVVTTFSNNARARRSLESAQFLTIPSRKRHLQELDDNSDDETDFVPSLNRLSSFERSIRLAATRANESALRYVILCRNGIGLQTCLARDSENIPVPSSLIQSLVTDNLQCTKYNEGTWRYLYGSPSSFPAYAAVVIIFVSLWAIIGFVSIYHALQLKFFSVTEQQQRQEILVANMTGRNKRVTTSTTTVDRPMLTSTTATTALLASQICFRVFLYWMLTILTLLRCLYFLWLLLWPAATANDTFLHTQNFVACREFFFLHYRNDLAATANASAAYHFVLGWYYCFFVFTVYATTVYEWKYHSQQQSQLPLPPGSKPKATGTSSSSPETQTDNATIVTPADESLIKYMLSCCLVVTSLLVFMITVTAGLLWNYHNNTAGITIVATVTLLVCQSVTGLLLCMCLAPIYLLLYIQQQQRQQQQLQLLLIAYLLVILGILQLLAAHESVLENALAAFVCYSLLPRISEILVISFIMRRLDSHSHAQLNPTTRNDRLAATTSIQYQHKTTRKPSSPYPHINLQQRQYQNFVSDRFMDVESHLYPHWIQTWRDEDEDEDKEVRDDSHSGHNTQRTSGKRRLGRKNYLHLKDEKDSVLHEAGLLDNNVQQHQYNHNPPQNSMIAEVDLMLFDTSPNLDNPNLHHHNNTRIHINNNHSGDSDSPTAEEQERELSRDHNGATSNYRTFKTPKSVIVSLSI